MNTRNYKTILAAAALLLFGSTLSSAQSISKRNILSLNGTWQIAEGKKDIIPNSFTHTVQVPGLVSLAVPAFKDVGPKVSNRISVSQSDTLREAFWYHRTFNIKGPIPAVAQLKIAKATYGTKVFLNGKSLGEHLPCFTPGYFNAKETLKTGVNELLVRVGSSRDAIHGSVVDGFDFEKERYIPGIFDNVQLILSGATHIVNVQTVPDVINKQVRVQLNVESLEESKTTSITFTVEEVNSKKVVGVLKKDVKLLGATVNTIGEISIPIKDCHFWSPESPFLYNLKISTGSDESQTTFGMREFHFDHVTHKAVLNGKPYFMRGSNITLYRFFEDSAGKSLPWDSVWVRNLFKSFKKFHWNSLRFCIGLPPEQWYKIADEEGFLIQDEYPIWYGGKGRHLWPQELNAQALAKEYTEWMQENWNHPSVVIWDASNETLSGNTQTDETAEAVLKVRNLDISNRPWDNSYSRYRSPGDVFESHPYHFNRPDFKLSKISSTDTIPQGNGGKNLENFPVIINEYGWLWLNRDGSPTTLTEKLYKNLLGENSTVAQRRHLYAMYTAAETEFWRCHRKAAAVLHFTALGYSRSDGQTSDNFINPAKLEYEGEFLKYLPDAFSPVGIMLNEWGNEIEIGKVHDFNIIAINDLEPNWKGSVHLQILKGDRIMIDKFIPLAIPSYGKKTISIKCNTPKKAGLYTVQAVLDKPGATAIKSIREIVFK